MARPAFSFSFFFFYAACVLQPIFAFGALIFVMAAAGAAGGRGSGGVEYLILLVYLLLNVGLFRFFLGRLRALHPGAGRLLPKLAIASPISAIALAYLVTAATLQTQLRSKAELRHCGNNTKTPLCAWFPCLTSVHQASDEAMERLGIVRKGGKLTSRPMSLMAGSTPVGTEIQDPISPWLLCVATANSIRFKDITDEQFRELVGPGASQWDPYMLFYRPGK